MTSDRLKNLAKIRLILSVIAVLLACMMVISGIMHFSPLETKSSEENPSESAAEPVSTTAAETTAATETEATITEATIAETTISTEAAEETTEPMTEPVNENLQPKKAGAIKKPTSEAPSADIDHHNRPSGSGSNSGSESDGNHGSDSGNNDGSGSNDGAGNNDSTNNNNTDSGSTGSDNTGSNNTNSGSTGNSNTGSNNTNSGSTGSSNTGSNNTNSGSSNTGSVTETPSNVSVPEGQANDTFSSISASVALTETPEPYTAEPEVTVHTDPAESTALTEATVLAETTAQTEPPITNHLTVDPPDPGMDIWGIVFWSSASLLAVDLLAILWISNQIQKEKALARQKPKKRPDSRPQPDTHASAEKKPRPVPPVERTEVLSAIPQIASIHQMGRRDYQQDSLGHSLVLDDQGLLAVVADGMGGLANGERVSQKIVMDALAIGSQLKQDQVNGCLWKAIERINENTNRMLGADGLYKSGSTLVAVLTYANHFQWISVGDSRIYLYRQGYANQLNQDHDHLQVLMADVLSGRLTMEEALRNPDGRKLTSFIGMGQLKYVDGSRSAISLEKGDRLVLMSDGVYNIINEDRLADVLTRHPNVNQAASVMERIIRDKNHPQQDNYTAIILGF